MNRDIIKLEIVSNMLTLMSDNGFYYIVESVWQDIDKGLCRSEIVAHNPHENPNSILESWKALSDSDHEMVLNCERPYDFAEVAHVIKNRRYFRDR